MARKRIEENGAGHPPDTNGTQAPTNGTEAPANNNGNGNGRTPIKVFSYLIGHETYVQVSVWQREGKRRDGGTFTTYDLSLRKRYKNSRDNEWTSLYSFAPSETFAAIHALQQATAFVTELRAVEEPAF